MQNDAQLRLFPTPRLPQLLPPGDSSVTDASDRQVFVARVRRGATDWTCFGPYRTHELARRVGARFGRVPISAVVVARYESEADVIGTREGQRNHI